MHTVHAHAHTRTRVSKICTRSARWNRTRADRWPRIKRDRSLIAFIGGGDRKISLEAWVHEDETSRRSAEVGDGTWKKRRRWWRRRMRGERERGSASSGIGRGARFSFGSFYESDRVVISETLCGTRVPPPQVSRLQVHVIRETVFTRSFE